MDPTVISALMGMVGILVGAILNSAIQFFKTKLDAKKIPVEIKKQEMDIAGELIEHAKGLLEPYREEVVALKDINKELRKENLGLKVINQELKIINDQLKEENRKFAQVVSDFQLEINNLKQSLIACNDCLQQLKNDMEENK